MCSSQHREAAAEELISYACRHGHVETVRRLLEAGVDKDMQIKFLGDEIRTKNLGAYIPYTALLPTKANGH